MKILLIISSLSSGGAERVLSIMANYWSNYNNEVILITLDEGEDFYKLNPEVKRIRLNESRDSLNIFQGVINNFIRIQKLRQEIVKNRPDVIISFIDQINVLAILANLGLKIPIIISERIDPTMHNIGFLWSKLRRLFYHKADFLVVQSKSVYIWATTFLHEKQVAIVPNPISVIDNCTIKDTQEESNKPFRVISIGRLVHQKGFDILIKAFATITKKHENWNLIIYGEGSERSELETLVKNNGIEEKVSLPGKTSNPFVELSKSDLFVLPSRYEGFPNVLLEAMSCGLPVISTDCPSGPIEIIRNDENGILVDVENVDSLVVAMDELMSNPDKRIKFSVEAFKVRDMYSIETVMMKWNMLIESVTKKGISLK